MWLYHGVASPNDADGIANSVDPDQTAPLGLLLIWVCTVCSGISVRKLRIITVVMQNVLEKKGKAYFWGIFVVFIIVSFTADLSLHLTCMMQQ